MTARSALQPVESDLVVIRLMGAGLHEDSEERMPVSLPRLIFLDGEYQPPEPELPIRRVERVESDALTDWVGLPRFRSASTASPHLPRVNAQAIAEQRHQARLKAKEQIRRLVKKVKVTRIMIARKRILAQRKRLRAIKQHVDSSAILQIVSEFSGYTISELQGPARQKNIVYWRMIAIHLIRKNRPVSTAFIGGMLGDRDHSTIMHSLGKVEANYHHFAEDIKRVEALL